ncbi:replication initiator protein A, partial [Azospirillum argentinense]
MDDHKTDKDNAEMLDRPVQLALRLDSPLRGDVNNDRALMAYSLFGLSKDKVESLPTYDDGKVKIEVRAPRDVGVATIWDKSVLIYAVSLLREKMAEGKMGPEVGKLHFTTSDLQRIVGKTAGGSAYDKIEGALERLQGTQIKTNLEAGGEGESGAFSWISDYKLLYRRGKKDGERQVRGLTLVLSNWVVRAALGNNLLTYSEDYFALKPIEKRLYEIARAHLGHGNAFWMALEPLRKRVGSDNDLRKFKNALGPVLQADRIPGYGVRIVEVAEYKELMTARGASIARVLNADLPVIFWRKDAGEPESWIDIPRVEFDEVV